ncbi:hypothetical protein [Dactylosporangium sp. NPDC000521]|uniref:hypothetical protein n=1 Tax=Dactylosporangium sp. NPDC000521 TaxID=3363975 RepID=UPI003697686D
MPFLVPLAYLRGGFHVLRLLLAAAILGGGQEPQRDRLVRDECADGAGMCGGQVQADDRAEAEADRRWRARRGPDRRHTRRKLT